ncbi:alpha/beta fold hydrolase [Paenibacillus sp. DMB5]|uniref:dienelactone hydrolase family protein n=1 Tax=Paenibacillus sp. DMB5 TaxID=1780103 RepID=UPI00076D8B5C|nr:alpha/beta fold hydrolase [Paenibacillus sp. DMB5]KUP23409.1 hydrolase [Paenibacillus sp. DMB5]
MSNHKVPLESLLGDLPEHGPGPVEAVLLKQEIYDGFRMESLLLELNGLEKVPATLVKPLVGDGPFPLVLFNHSHGGNYTNGRKELLNSSTYLQSPSFAKTLTAMGYAVCCIDMWGFNERGGKAESELVKEMLWTGKVLWGMMLYDSRRALDYLCCRDDIDAERIGTIGMSMGGLMAWWLAALDERVKVTVDICGQVDAQTLIDKRGLDHHGFYSYVPGLLKHYTTLEIQQRIVPRPRMSLNGRSDRMCPAEGVRLLDEGLSAAYEAAGKPENWRNVTATGGHMETLEMRVAWQAFLAEHL